MFRELSNEEAEEFRRWARANYQRGGAINSVWHPVVQAECLVMNREPAPDVRTLAELAREALQVQDACNLSGVAHGYVRSICRLRALLPEAGTTRINEHPISQLWADKIASLTGTQFDSNWSTRAYRAVYEMAEGAGSEASGGAPAEAARAS
jgi:hypothetical protein